MTVQIAPGVKYNTWSFSGHGAPGPILHVRQGQLVKMTLTNGGAIPHSIDFHAARIAPNLAFRDVDPGKSFLPVPGERPGRLHVPLRHQAGTDAHRERHVRRDRGSRAEALPGLTRTTSSSRASGTSPPTGSPSPPVRHGQGPRDPARLDDVQRVREAVRQASVGREPRRGSYASGSWPPGRRSTPTSTSSGPSSTAPRRRKPRHAQRDVQTVNVPAGGGGVFDVKIDKPGLYPFVSHAFAAVDSARSAS